MRSRMKALVKSEAEPGIWMKDIAEPEGRPQRRADQDRARPRSAAPTCTSTTGTPGRRRPFPVPMAVGHEYCGRDRRDGQRSARLRDRRSRLGRRPHHLRLSAATAAPGAGTCAATPSASASIARAASPNTCRSRPSTPSSCRTRSPTTSRRILDPFGNATHTALAFNMVGEDVLITGAGPDRHHGRRRSRATSARATSSSPT